MLVFLLDTFSKKLHLCRHIMSHYDGRTFLLNQADVFSLELAWREANALAPKAIVAKSCSIPDFPFVNCVLTAINQTAASNFSSLDSIKMQIMCSAEWPVCLEFAMETAAAAAKEEEAEEKVPKKSKRSKTTKEEDALNNRRSKRGKTTVDAQELNFDAIPPGFCCTEQDMNAIKAENGKITPQIMETLMARVIERHGEKRAASVVWREDILSEDIVTLVARRGGRTLAFIPFQYGDCKWNTAVICCFTNRATALLAMDEHNNGDDDGMFARVHARANKAIRCLDPVSMPASNNGDGSWLSVLSFAAWFLRVEQCSCLRDFKQRVIRPLADQAKASKYDGAQLKHELIADLQGYMALAAQRALLPKKELPRLPAAFPPITATYKDLYVLFAKCGEQEYIRTHLRPVPGSRFAANSRYTKNSQLNNEERRKLVWSRCEAYLRERFRF